ncbi:MAG: TAXI family TRAP transporter solute-binding subunit [Rhodobacteraceae bacterium]|nr:TAXI family TRAP transporter solute-binding subunit [Paracoccaceae bacterium]MBR9823580.1 TAXI family TRAP transporter solute-binding subunit [Paracoccaceae bacterium]
MRVLTVSLVAGLLSTSAVAGDYSLPKTVTWTAYSTGSSGYNQAVAIGAALQADADINLRVLPGNNDLARLEPVRQGKVQFASNGVGTYLAQEGVLEFTDPNWGPQKVRVLLNNLGSGAGLALGVSRTACEKVGKPGCEGFTLADLKGLRVPQIMGSPSMNMNVEAFLAYGDLTWDDTEVVEFGGFGAAWKGMVDGSVDAGFAITSAGNAFEAEASPNGLFWPAIDPDDTAALDRLKAVAPYFVPVTATEGAGLNGEAKVLTAYPYPILMAYAEQDGDLVYNMTKAMAELYDDYKDDAPGAIGWSLDNQVFDWVVPFHEGSVRFLQEAGYWSEEAQAHNDALIHRQDVLAAAWRELKEAEPEGDWAEAWSRARREALEAEGLPAPF